jgi:hypothetical protein
MQNGSGKSPRVSGVIGILQEFEPAHRLKNPAPKGVEAMSAKEIAEELGLSSRPARERIRTALDAGVLVKYDGLRKDAGGRYQVVPVYGPGPNAKGGGK